MQAYTKQQYKFEEKPAEIDVRYNKTIDQTPDIHDIEQSDISHSGQNISDISEFNLPRGKGGVGIVWSSSISGKVTKIDEGNERIIGILIKSDPKICLICVYLPTNNASVNSVVEYGECLDILDFIINNYSDTHRIVIAGDLNGTLLKPRAGNKHDVCIHSFVRDHKLIVSAATKHTFMQHSGAGSSQIGYILSSHKDLIQDYIIHEKHATNLSSHTIVSAVINISFASIQRPSQQSSAIWKYQWEKMDIHTFQNTLRLELENSYSKISSDPTIEIFMSILQKATKASTPRKIIYLKGPKWKASPAARMLITNCHKLYREWCEKGKPEGPLKQQKITDQRELRRQFRMEKYTDRQDLYNQIMENPTTELFHRLIRRNRGKSVVKTPYLQEGNIEVNDPDKQRECFLKYFEDLAIPKDNGYDEKYLELYTIRHKLITEFGNSADDPLEPFTEVKIQNGIKHLHTGKATDEFEICSEQLKASGDILLPSITTTFNSILSFGSFPEILKSGILTPILKKTERSFDSG
ncbi:uncharacterized protein [Mytilus edulis]|uniref:uncharacterized protein n=1 Tax=Mytilus edulis TaxID=6550 RepID=UPI0039EEB5F3